MSSTVAGQKWSDIAKIKDMFLWCAVCGPVAGEAKKLFHAIRCPPEEYIGDVMFFNRVLTQDEIQQLAEVFG